MTRFTIAVMPAAILLAMLAAVSWAQLGAAPEDAVPIVRPMVGSTLDEIVAMLGKPFYVVPLRQTGGKLLFFENAHGDHYVIETDGTGRVVDAVVKHPEGR
jgi:hypothetical protein